VWVKEERKDVRELFMCIDWCKKMKEGHCWLFLEDFFPACCFSSAAQKEELR